MENSMSFQIISDSSCDLPQDIINSKQIHVVPFYLSFDGENYKKEGVEIEVREFYQNMVDQPGVYPKTSMPSTQDYIDVFELYAKQGIPMICICISTKFSGSYNSAMTAKEMVLEDYKDAQIAVIDATVNTVLQGLLVLELVKMKENSYTFSQSVEAIETLKTTGRIIFTIGSVDYLKNGGRIGKVMGIAAGVLKIRPLIMLKEGEIFPLGIARKREKSKQMVLEQVKKYFADSGENPEDYEICVGYGYDKEEGEAFAKEFEESLAQYSSKREIKVYQIGAAIGVHTGPEPIGVAFIKKYDKQ